MELSLEIFILIIPFLSVILVALIYLTRYIWKQRKSTGFFRFFWEVTCLPFSFSKIFSQRRKEKQLPLYFQYFLKFTRFCSRIPYFHFLPKFLVATTAEFLIHIFTGEPLLTGLIFTWSFFFFITITIVESLHGDFEEEIITLANKLFLFSVSLLLLFCVILWMFFWKQVEPILTNSFFQTMSHIADFFNEKLGGMLLWIWHLPIWGKIAIVLIFFLYVYSSLYLSKKGIK